MVEQVRQVAAREGVLLFHVKTQDGGETFMMPWRGDRADDHSQRGKLLLDAYDDRCVIPDLEAPRPADERGRWHCQTGSGVKPEGPAFGRGRFEQTGAPG